MNETRPDPQSPVLERLATLEMHVGAQQTSINALESRIEQLEQRLSGLLGANLTYQPPPQPIERAAVTRIR